MRAIKPKGTFRIPTLDKAGWLRKLETTMTETLKDAAVAWLIAATAPIPTWSGASLGTFSKLAADVDFQLTISPTANGARLGIGPGGGAAAGQGRLDINASKGRFAFEYSTTLAHLIFNEFNNANVTPDPSVFGTLHNPGPYNFQEAGAAAFEAFAATAELPAPRVTTKTTIRLK